MALYQELETRGLLDLPNVESAAIIKTVAVNDVAVADATTFMRTNLLWYWSAPDVMSGAIQIALDDGTLADLAEALGELWSSLFGQSASILHVNSNTEVAVRIHTGWVGMITSGVVSQLEMDSFYSLGGGLMFPNCTAEDVQQAKNLEAERIAIEKAEMERQERSDALMAEYQMASDHAGVEEALYEGDEPALIIALRDTADQLEG